MPLLAGSGLGVSVHAQTPPGAGLPAEAVQQALALAGQAAQALAPPGARVLVSPGAIDPRLQLAPCAKIEPAQSRANRPGAAPASPCAAWKARAAGT
jgi:hypothetical protein